MTEGRMAAWKSDRVHPAGHPSWVSVGGDGIGSVGSVVAGRIALCGGLRVFGVYFCGFHVVNLHQTANYVVSIAPCSSWCSFYGILRLFRGHFSKCGGTYPANNKVTAMRGSTPNLSLCVSARKNNKRWQKGKQDAHKNHQQQKDRRRQPATTTTTTNGQQEGGHSRPAIDNSFIYEK